MNDDHTRELERKENGAEGPPSGQKEREKGGDVEQQRLSVNGKPIGRPRGSKNRPKDTGGITKKKNGESGEKNSGENKKNGNPGGGKEKENGPTDDQEGRTGGSKDTKKRKGISREIKSIGKATERTKERTKAISKKRTTGGATRIGGARTRTAPPPTRVQVQSEESPEPTLKLLREPPSSKKNDSVKLVLRRRPDRHEGKRSNVTKQMLNRRLQKQGKLIKPTKLGNIYIQNGVVVGILNAPEGTPLEEIINFEAEIAHLCQVPIENINSNQNGIYWFARGRVQNIQALHGTKDFSSARDGNKDAVNTAAAQIEKKREQVTRVKQRVVRLTGENAATHITTMNDMPNSSLGSKKEFSGRIRQKFDAMKSSSGGNDPTVTQEIGGYNGLDPEDTEMGLGDEILSHNDLPMEARDATYSYRTANGGGGDPEDPDDDDDFGDNPFSDDRPDAMKRKLELGEEDVNKLFRSAHMVPDPIIPVNPNLSGALYYAQEREERIKPQRETTVPTNKVPMNEVGSTYNFSAFKTHNQDEIGTHLVQHVESGNNYVSPSGAIPKVAVTDTGLRVVDGDNFNDLETALFILARPNQYSEEVLADAKQLVNSGKEYKNAAAALGGANLIGVPPDQSVTSQKHFARTSMPIPHRDMERRSNFIAPTVANFRHAEGPEDIPYAMKSDAEILAEQVMHVSRDNREEVMRGHMQLVTQLNNVVRKYSLGLVSIEEYQAFMSEVLPKFDEYPLTDIYGAGVENRYIDFISSANSMHQYSEVLKKNLRGPGDLSLDDSEAITLFIHAAKQQGLSEGEIGAAVASLYEAAETEDNMAHHSIFSDTLNREEATLFNQYDAAAENLRRVDNVSTRITQGYTNDEQMANFEQFAAALDPNKEEATLNMVEGLNPDMVSGTLPLPPQPAFGNKPGDEDPYLSPYESSDDEANIDNTQDDQFSELARLQNGKVLPPPLVGPEDAAYNLILNHDGIVVDPDAIWETNGETLAPEPGMPPIAFRTVEGGGGPPDGDSSDSSSDEDSDMDMDVGGEFIDDDINDVNNVPDPQLPKSSAEMELDYTAQMDEEMAEQIFENESERSGARIDVIAAELEELKTIMQQNKVEVNTLNAIMRNGNQEGNKALSAQMDDIIKAVEVNSKTTEALFNNFEARENQNMKRFAPPDLNGALGSLDETLVGIFEQLKGLDRSFKSMQNTNEGVSRDDLSKELGNVARLIQQFEEWNKVNVQAANQDLSAFKRLADEVTTISKRHDALRNTMTDLSGQTETSNEKLMQEIGSAADTTGQRLLEMQAALEESSVANSEVVKDIAASLISQSGAQEDRLMDQLGGRLDRIIHKLENFAGQSEFLNFLEADFKADPTINNISSGYGTNAGGNSEERDAALERAKARAEQSLKSNKDLLQQFETLRTINNPDKNEDSETFTDITPGLEKGPGPGELLLTGIEKQLSKLTEQLMKTREEFAGNLSKNLNLASGGGGGDPDGILAQLGPTLSQALGGVTQLFRYLIDSMRIDAGEETLFVETVSFDAKELAGDIYRRNLDQLMANVGGVYYDPIKLQHRGFGGTAINQNLKTTPAVMNNAVNPRIQYQIPLNPLPKKVLDWDPTLDEDIQGKYTNNAYRIGLTGDWPFDGPPVITKPRGFRQKRKSVMDMVRRFMSNPQNGQLPARQKLSPYIAPHRQRKKRRFHDIEERVVRVEQPPPENPPVEDAPSPPRAGGGGSNILNIINFSGVPDYLTPL